MSAVKTVRVGWAGRPELGSLECDVVESRDFGRLNVGDGPTPTKVRYCSGKLSRVVYCHSQGRFVFR